jgi:simple sugar transport system ATP-binding protein
VLYGQERATRGAIFLNGRPVHFRNPGQAIARGLGMVHQEILLVPEYTVWENVVLGVEPVTAWGRLDAAQARARVQARITEFGFALDPDARAGDLSVAARQKVEILKLLYREVSVLILDEPTAVLTPQEIPQLFDELRRLRNGGQTILFISHHLDEVLALSDRITILRKGRKVDTVSAAGLSEAQLAQLMIGRAITFTRRRSPGAPGPVIAALQDLACVDEKGRQRLKPLSLEVRAGEIVGVAGVEGNGQLELVSVLMGLLPANGGRFSVNGHDLTHAGILERRRRMAFVPQDRRAQGASVTAPILDNALMTHHRLTPELSQWGGLLLNYQRARTWMQSLRERFAVAMTAADAPFRSLSGGNQQKVILGRELLLDRPFLLLDQPTRGLDVGSMEYVHAQIVNERDEGRAILLFSADLEELFSLADRIAVMHRGALVAVAPTEQTTVDEVGYWMLQGQALQPGSGQALRRASTDAAPTDAASTDARSGQA